MRNAGDVWNDVAAMINERGRNLSKADLSRIRALVEQMPEQDQQQINPWLAESLWLICADPDYRGDIDQLETL